MMILVSLLAAAVALAAPGPPAVVVHASGAWVALDRGGACEATSRAMRTAARGQPQASAGFVFDADRRRWGEFRARLGRVPRAGATVIATIGDQPFLLLWRGQAAWSRSPAQEAAMLDAARNGRSMRIAARDSSGRRFTDRYLLDGAPTAIDAAAARCAGKMPRR